MKVSLTGAVNF